jgi:uncharacterized protein (TIRG00374 family)
LGESFGSKNDNSQQTVHCRVLLAAGREQPVRGLTRPLILSVLVGAALYGGSLLIGDLNALEDAYRRIGPGGLAAVAALALSGYLLRFLRWQGYLNALGHSVPVLASLRYYIAGFALITTPGKAGEAIRSVYLRRHGVGYDHSLAALLVERVADLAALALLAAVVGLQFATYRWATLLVAALVVLAIGAVTYEGARNMLRRALAAVPLSCAQSLAQQLASSLAASARLLRPRSLSNSIALGLLAWGVEGVGFFLIVQALGITDSAWLAIGIYAAAVLVGAISFLPGGLGGTEAVMGGLLLALGASPEDAVVATVLSRLGTLWFAVALGVAAMARTELEQLRTA